MDFLIGVLNTLIVLVSVFLVCIILIQRGKGGGLAGAFGGVGGSSAFGTKAGDVFTRITIGVAIGWMLALMLLVILMNSRAGSVSSGWGDDTSTPSKAVSPSKAAPGAGTKPGPADLTPSPATDTGLGAPPIPEPVKASPAPASGSPAPAPASTPEKPAAPSKK